jgi:hypothetical protein
MENVLITMWFIISASSAPPLRVVTLMKTSDLKYKRQTKKTYYGDSCECQTSVWPRRTMLFDFANEATPSADVKLNTFWYGSTLSLHFC